MKSSKMALSVGGLLFAASCCIAPVHASEFYGGTSLLYGQREKYNDLDTSWGGKGFVGYRFSPIPIFLEAEFLRSEEHTSELQSLMRISYAVFCLKKKKITSHTYKRQTKENKC